MRYDFHAAADRQRRANDLHQAEVERVVFAGARLVLNRYINRYRRRNGYAPDLDDQMEFVRDHLNALEDDGVIASWGEAEGAFSVVASGSYLDDVPRFLGAAEESDG